MNFENLITAVKYSWRDERIQKMYKECKHAWVSEFRKKSLGKAKFGGEWLYLGQRVFPIRFCA